MSRIRRRLRAAAWCAITAVSLGAASAARADEAALSAESVERYVAARPRISAAKTDAERAAALQEASLTADEAAAIEATAGELRREAAKDAGKPPRTRADDVRDAWADGVKKALEDPAKQEERLYSMTIAVLSLQLPAMAMLPDATPEQRDRIEALQIDLDHDSKKKALKLDDLVRRFLEIERDVFARSGKFSKKLDAIDAELADLKAGREPKTIREVRASLNEPDPDDDAPADGKRDGRDVAKTDHGAADAPPPAPPSIALPSPTHARNRALVRARLAAVVGDAPAAPSKDLWRTRLRDPSRAVRLKQLEALNEEAIFGMMGGIGTQLADAAELVAEVLRVVDDELTGPPAMAGATEERVRPGKILGAASAVLVGQGRPAVEGVAPWIDGAQPARCAFAARVLQGIADNASRADVLKKAAELIRKGSMDPRFMEELRSNAEHAREAVAVQRPRIRAALDGPDAAARIALLKALTVMRYDDEATFTAVTKLSGDAAASVRTAALGALGGAGDALRDRALGSLVTALGRTAGDESDDDDQDAVDEPRAAAIALLAHGDPGLTFLTQRWGSVPQSGRIAVLEVLQPEDGAKPTRARSPALIAFLQCAVGAAKSEDETHAALAAARIYGVRDSARVLELAKGFADGDEMDAIKKLGALRDLGPDAAPAVPELVKWLESHAGQRDSESMLLLPVLDVLARIGTGAKDALPVLRRLDEKGGVWAPMVHRTISKIEGRKHARQDAEDAGDDEGD